MYNIANEISTTRGNSNYTLSLAIYPLSGNFSQSRDGSCLFIYFKQNL